MQTVSSLQLLRDSLAIPMGEQKLQVEAPAAVFDEIS